MLFVSKQANEISILTPKSLVQSKSSEPASNKSDILLVEKNIQTLLLFLCNAQNENIATNMVDSRVAWSKNPDVAQAKFLADSCKIRSFASSQTIFILN